MEVRESGSPSVMFICRGRIQTSLLRSKGCALRALPHHPLHVCYLCMLASCLALNGFREVSRNVAYLMDNAAHEQLN